MLLACSLAGYLADIGYLGGQLPSLLSSLVASWLCMQLAG